MLQWAMRKIRLPDVLVRSMMSLCDGVITNVRVYSELSDEFEDEVGMHQVSMLSHFPLAVVVDAVTEFVRDSALRDLLHADDLVLMSETIEGRMNKFLIWNEACDSNGLKVIFGKTMAMISCGITKDGMSKSKVEPYGVCSMSVKANLVLCVLCGAWIHTIFSRQKG